MHRAFTLALTSLALCPALLCGAQPQNCGKSPHPYRVDLRHIETRGIGYHKGYTTVEGFFTFPSTLKGRFVPFLDLRAHVFNDTRPAVNTGLGLRYLSTSRVWGANVYYDYRKTQHFHYNQVGFGLESLGDIWDFRANGYFPVGERHSSQYHFVFDSFQGNNFFLRSKREFAMIGGNAEAAAHAYKHKNFDVYAAAGPYYFEGEGRVAWGGQARVVMTAWDHLRMQVNGSYDKIFKGIIQGEIGVTVPFGGRRKISAKPNCPEARMVLSRAVQRVDRQEIIVVDRRHKKSVAINPATGQPYTVWFVDNTSHSLGTVESPFPTLLAAESASHPNDIIYVLPGDGTDTGMNTGIFLQKGQQLLGASIPHRVETSQGGIKIPAHANRRPTISNTLAGAMSPAVHMLTSGNVVSGFNVVDNISAIGITIEGSNHVVTNNILITGGATGHGIFLNGGSNIAIVDNTFLSTSALATNGIFGLDMASAFGGNITISNNLFKGVDANTGFNVALQIIAAFPNVGNFNLRIIDNIFTSQTDTSTGSAAIAVDQLVPNTQRINCALEGNYINMPAGITHGVAGVVVTTTAPGGFLKAVLTNNTSITTPPTVGYFFHNTSGNPDALDIEFFGRNVGTVVGP